MREHEQERHDQDKHEPPVDNGGEQERTHSTHRRDSSSAKGSEDRPKSTRDSSPPKVPELSLEAELAALEREATREEEVVAAAEKEPLISFGDGGIRSQGELGFEGRAFVPKDDDPTDPYNVAFVGRVVVDLEHAWLRSRARGFFRYDERDSQRSVVYPEEVWLDVRSSRVRLRLGYQLLNWTATEAFHPADVVNSRYFDGNVNNPEKLGELMGALRVKLGNGLVEGFFMPLFTAPVLPSNNSRFRFGQPGVSLGEALVLARSGEPSDDRLALQFGARAQYTLRGADLSMHVVDHIGRSLPLILVDPDTAVPHPTYQRLLQVGGTYQQAIHGLLVKLEAAYRRFDQPVGNITEFGTIPRRNHVIGAIGFEYSVGHGKSGRSTLLLEGEYAHFLSRHDPGTSLLVFDHDVLVGYRYERGDLADQSFTATVVVDARDPGQMFGMLFYSRRLGDAWRVGGGARVFRVPPRDPDNPVGVEFLNEASYLHLDLTRYF